jgi:hypothetical protein
MAIARLREEQLIYQAKRGTYRLNNSVIADWLRENTPEMGLEATASPACPPATCMPLIPD